MVGKFLGFSSSKKMFKALDSVRSRTENLFKGCLKENIFYLHVDKCGGSSISQAIKSCYYSWNIVEDRNLAHLDSISSFIAAKIKAGKVDFLPSVKVDDEVETLKFRENLLLYYMSHEQIKYIAGHFSFSQTAHRYFSGKYAFITVLREPVSRWISSYFYNRFKRLEYGKVKMDIKEYLESELGRSHGCEYVKYLRGNTEKEELASEKAIEEAKQNLHKFSIVGCLEYQEDFIKRFAERFDRKLMIYKINKNPKTKIYQSLIITDELKEKIKEICKPDLEIYQYAVENFVKK